MKLIGKLAIAVAGAGALGAIGSIAIARSNAKVLNSKELEKEANKTMEAILKQQEQINQGWNDLGVNKEEILNNVAQRHAELNEEINKSVEEINRNIVDNTIQQMQQTNSEMINNINNELNMMI